MQDCTNIFIIGVNLADTAVASSIRVRNLFDTVVNNSHYSVINIVSEDNSSKLSYNPRFYKASGYFRFLSFISLIMESKRKFQRNLLYCYGSISINYFDLILVCKILKIPIIFDIIENVHIKGDLRRFVSHLNFYFTTFFERHLYWFADECIVISSKLFRLINQLSQGRYPVVHIPISVKLNEWDYHYSKIDEKTIIFYGGSFGPKDGLNYLFAAFDNIASDYPLVELHLSGKGAERHIKITKENINNLAHKEGVKLLGSLEREDYVKKVLSADIVCVTRTNSVFANYGFPFKLGEYLAAGKAIIVSDVGDVSKYLEHGVDSYFVVPESFKSIETALRNLIDDPNLRIKIGQNAKQKARLLFDSQKIGLEFEKCILTLFMKKKSNRTK